MGLLILSFVRWLICINLNNYNFYTLKVDGTTILNPIHPINLEKGCHCFEIVGIKLSTKKLFKKIISGMFSGLCGAVIYTLDDAFNDIYDDCISFLYCVNEKEENILIEDIIDSNISEFHKTSIINKKRLFCMVSTMFLPLMILCFSLSMLFIFLGIIAIGNNKYSSGIFVIFIGSLFLLMTLFSIINLKKQLKSSQTSKKTENRKTDDG